MSAALDFNFERVDRGDIVVFSVTGYMGNAECARLEGELALLLIGSRRHVVLDLGGLGFATTASLERLARLAGGFERRGGALRLCGVPAGLRQVVRIACPSPAS